MKKEVLIGLAIAVVIALGVQTYMIFQLNNKVAQLSETANSHPIKKPLLNTPAFPNQKFDEDFFKQQPWNPYEEMQQMQEEMEKVFGDSFSRFHLHTPSGSYSRTPDLDLQEKSDSFIVTVNAPGVDKSSVNVRLKNQVLEISMKTEHGTEQRQDNQGYVHRERFSGEFHRSLTLPSPVEEGQMKTEYKNGVLTITIPKKLSGTPA